MSASSKPAGLEIGSTRPLSRAERRAQAARVVKQDAGDSATMASPTAMATAAPVAPAEVVYEQPRAAAAGQPSVQLKTRQRKPKSPFATQLHPATLARLEWIKARGYVITDTVDDAINAYLDRAGIPRPDDNDRMPPG